MALSDSLCALVVFQGLCSVLHSLDQGLVCSSNCNIETLKQTSFQCYYILLPSDKGLMLLRVILSPLISLILLKIYNKFLWKSTQTTYESVAVNKLLLFLKNTISDHYYTRILFFIINPPMLAAAGRIRGSRAYPRCRSVNYFFSSKRDWRLCTNLFTRGIFFPFLRVCLVNMCIYIFNLLIFLWF